MERKNDCNIVVRWQTSSMLTKQKRHVLGRLFRESAFTLFLGSYSVERYLSITTWGRAVQRTNLCSIKAVGIM